MSDKFIKWNSYEKRDPITFPKIVECTVGVISYPGVILIQSLVQNLLRQFGFRSINMEGMLQKTWQKFTSLPIDAKLVENATIATGTQLFFAEFIQDYLLKEKAHALTHALLTNVAPRYQNLVKTREFTIFRVCATSLTYALFRQTVEPVISSYWGSSSINNNPQFINDFVLALFANGSRVLAKSNLPGIGLLLANRVVNS